MNSAKKILKNEGLKKETLKRKVTSETEVKNKVLLIIGIVLAVGLSAMIAFVQFQPKKVLSVEGTASGAAVSAKLEMEDAMYDVYLLESQYNSLGNMYSQVYGTTFWEAQNVDNEGNDGQTAAKKMLIDNFKQREVLCLEAEANGVTLTDEEKKTAAESAKSAYGDLKDAQKKIAGLDEESIRTSIERQTLADKYKEQIIAGLGINEEALKATVKREDYKQYTLQYYSLEKKNIDADGNATEKTAEEQKADKEAMEALRAKASKAKDFSTGIIKDENNDYADDETNIEFAEYDLMESDEDFMTKELRNEIKKMKNGDISKVLENDESYFVVKMVNNDDSAAYDEQCETVINEEKEAKFTEKFTNEIAINYTITVEDYWNKSVKLGALSVA